jgi:hypothetical protein
MDRCQRLEQLGFGYLLAGDNRLPMQLMRWLAVRGALSDLYKDDLLAEAGILA